MWEPWGGVQGPASCQEVSTDTLVELKGGLRGNEQTVFGGSWILFFERNGEFPPEFPLHTRLYFSRLLVEQFGFYFYFYG